MARIPLPLGCVGVMFRLFSSLNLLHSLVTPNLLYTEEGFNSRLKTALVCIERVVVGMRETSEEKRLGT